MTRRWLWNFSMIALLAVGCGDEQAETNGGLPQDGADSIEEAIERGITWLASQAKDGKWMVKVGDKAYPNPAYTALAVTPIALSLPADKRASDELVASAAKFILAGQRDDGAIFGQDVKYENYYTSTSLMALSAIGDTAHESARNKMRDFLLTLQRKDKARIKGGFGYNTAKDSDLSNTQFAIEALRSAGIPDNHPAMQAAQKYLQRAQNRSENPENTGKVWEMKQDGVTVKVVPGNDGSAPYEPGVSKAGLQELPDGTFIARGYGSMTYALLKCYILVGLNTEDAKVKAVLDWLGDNYTWELNPGFQETAKQRPEAPYWGLYYYYMTAAKALRVAGVDELDTKDGKKNWRKDLAAAILSRQSENGAWINTKSSRWEEGDPLISTAYALIALHEIKGSK